jgi:hypothetical protein
MKKILAILALAASSSVFAVDSFTIEGSNVDNAQSANQRQYNLTVRKDFVEKLTGDIQFQNTQADGTNALTTRVETGLSYVQPIGHSGGLYIRAATGEKFSNTSSNYYYSVEPGATYTIGQTGLTARVGYRYRSAYDPNKYNDQTNTMRYGLSYALTKKDYVGVRYDRVNGDADQKIYAVNYTRVF